jgi:hypothetical protein
MYKINIYILEKNANYIEYKYNNVRLSSASKRKTFTLNINIKNIKFINKEL